MIPMVTYCLGGCCLPHPSRQTEQSHLWLSLRPEGNLVHVNGVQGSHRIGLRGREGRERGRKSEVSLVSVHVLLKVPSEVGTLGSFNPTYPPHRVGKVGL